jgi:hypothetical protein
MSRWFQAIGYQRRGTLLLPLPEWEGTEGRVRDLLMNLFIILFMALNYHSNSFVGKNPTKK